MIRLAFRNLARHRRRTGLVLAAIALGVMAVVGVRGFLNGLQRQLVTGFTEGQIGAIQIHAAGFMKSVEAAPLKPNMAINPALFATIEGVEGVRPGAVAPRLAFPALVSVGDQTAFALIVAVDPERELACCARRKEFVVEGAWFGAGKTDEALLGLEMMQGIGAKVGDTSKKIAVLGNDIDGVMNAVEATIVGAMAAPTQGEKKLALLPLSAGQELLRLPGRATEIAVGVRDVREVDAVADRLRAALGPAYEVHTWKQLAPFAVDVVQTQNKALDIVTSTFLLVILMGVANALLTSVLDRVREIGTMLAVGARRRQILQMFVVEAIALGALGAIIGSALGMLIVTALAQNGVSLTTPGATMPQLIVPNVEPQFLVRMVMLCAIGGAIASLWPALKASRLRPVEALAGGTTS